VGRGERGKDLPPFDFTERTGRFSQGWASGEPLQGGGSFGLDLGKRGRRFWLRMKRVKPALFLQLRRTLTRGGQINLIALHTRRREESNEV